MDRDTKVFTVIILSDLLLRGLRSKKVKITTSNNKNINANVFGMDKDEKVSTVTSPCDPKVHYENLPSNNKILSTGCAFILSRQYVDRPPL